MNEETDSLSLLRHARYRDALEAAERLQNEACQQERVDLERERQKVALWMFEGVAVMFSIALLLTAVTR